MESLKKTLQSIYKFPLSFNILLTLAGTQIFSWTFIQHSQKTESSLKKYVQKGYTSKSMWSFQQQVEHASQKFKLKHHFLSVYT